LAFDFLGKRIDRLLLTEDWKAILFDLFQLCLFCAKFDLNKAIFYQNQIPQNESDMMDFYRVRVKN
jgi:hypothetical protein